MPAPSRRSRTLRRIRKVMPSGKNKLTYARRKPAKAKCSSCGAVLKGVPRELPYKMSNMAKTKKRPERPFGGVLCSACARRTIIAKSRV